MTRGWIIQQLLWRVAYIAYSILILFFVFRGIHGIDEENTALLISNGSLAYGILWLMVFLGLPTLPTSFASCVALVLIALALPNSISPESRLLLAWSILMFGGYLQWFWFWPRYKKWPINQTQTHSQEQQPVVPR